MKSPEKADLRVVINHLKKDNNQGAQKAKPESIQDGKSVEIKDDDMKKKQEESKHSHTSQSKSDQEDTSDLQNWLKHGKEAGYIKSLEKVYRLKFNAEQEAQKKIRKKKSQAKKKRKHEVNQTGNSDSEDEREKMYKKMKNFIQEEKSKQKEKKIQPQLLR